jgi:hypothetical protein
MGASTETAGARLRRLARQSAGEREATLERCELCNTPIAPDHRHLLELPSEQLVCACRACALLFDREAAGNGRYRLVPERRLSLIGFDLSDIAWEELRLPVDMAFFFHSTEKERVAAFYPGPMGATESLLRFEAWQALEVANPVLLTLEPDVEAFLVDRALGARRHWIVPIDDCYQLVGLIRTSWRGLTGGKEVWQQLGQFYDGLDRRSRAVGRDGEKEETTWPG